MEAGVVHLLLFRGQTCANCYSDCPVANADVWAGSREACVQKHSSRMQRKPRRRAELNRFVLYIQKATKTHRAQLFSDALIPCEGRAPALCVAKGLRDK